MAVLTLKVDLDDEVWLNISSEERTAWVWAVIDAVNEHAYVSDQGVRGHA